MNLLDLFARISLDATEYEQGLNRAGTLATGFAGTLKKGLATAAKVGAAALTAATTAVGVFGKSSVDTGMQFDSSMSQVAATMGKTIDEIQDLRDFAMEMGAKTAFSATQAADALNYMALAGYTSEQSMAALPNVLNLAAAGGIELARASDMVTDAQSALGLSMAESAELVDKMAMSSSKSNTSVAQLGDAILTVGGTAKVLGGGMITLSNGEKKTYSATTELNQVLGLLADNGVKGAEGGTALRNIILSLTAPTDKAAKELKKLGVNVLDSSGDMRSMKDIFADLNRAMSGMSEGRKTEVLSDIFNKVDLKSVNALLGTNAERWEELATAIEDSKYAAERMADTQLDNLTGDITLMKSAFEGLQIVVSDGLTPDLRGFVQFATEGMTAVTDAFKQANEAQSLAQGFHDAEGAIRPIADIADELRERFGDTVTVASTISFRDAEGSLRDVSDIASELIEKLSSMSDEEQLNLAQALGLDDVDSLYEVLDENSGLTWKLQKLVEAADTAVSGDMNVLESLFPERSSEEVLALFDDTEEGVQELQNAVESVDAFIFVDGFTAAMEALPPVIDSGIEAILAGLPRIIEAGGQILGAVVTGIVNNLPVLAEGAVELVSTFGTSLVEHSSDILATGERLLTFLYDGIIDGLPVLAEAAGNLMTDFGQSLQNNLPVLIQSGLEAVVGLTAAIRENAGKIADGAIALAKGLAQGLVDSIPTVIENVPTIVSNIANAINDNAPKILVSGIEIIITLVKGLIQAIPTLIENIPKIVTAIVDVIVAYNWVSLGSNIITWLKNGINALKEAIPNVVKNIGQKAKNFITNIDWRNVGTSIINFIRNGINFLRENIPKALKAIGKAAIEKVKSIDWLELGKNIVSGIAQGIRDHAKLALDAAAGLARRILHRGEEELGVSSPSKEFAWVGRMVDEGFAKGIEENADKVEDKAAKLAKNVYSAVTAAAERQIKYERLSLTEQLDLWRAIQEQFAKESDQWWDAEDKIFDLREKKAQEEEDLLKNLYQTLANSAEKQVKREKLSLIEQLNVWLDIRRQFLEGSEQYASAEEKIYDLRKDIQEEYYSKVKEVNANIAALEENYQKTLESRTKEIFNSYKLFDEIPKQQSVSGEKLISNLKGQINSIQGFYSALERLEERGAGAALVSELRDMGPSAMSQLDALLQLSDQRLSEYAGLYEEKQQLANSIAIQELRELRTETDAQIREQLASVEDLYEKNAPVVGEMFPQGLAKGILSGMSTAVSAAVEVAKAVENAIREKTETHSPSRLFARIGQGMAEGLGIGWTDEYRHIKDQIEDGMNFKGATATVDFASRGLNRLATATGAAFANMMTGIPDNNGEIVVNITAELDGAVLARKMVRYNRDERFLRGGAFS